MAIMCPPTPKAFCQASREGEVFALLEKALPSDYFVFHSYEMNDVDHRNKLHESELDFVIFHPEKGILCLEVKSGIYQYKNGLWRHSDGTPMNNNGPYGQAKQHHWDLRKHIERVQGTEDGVLKRCRTAFGVWFLSINQEQFGTITAPDAEPELTMLSEDLYEPLNGIDRLFSITRQWSKLEPGEMTEEDQKFLLHKVLTPEFNLVSSTDFSQNLKEVVFHRLLKEQAKVLDFLEEQESAAIRGVAGTGKTLVALEWARRHHEKGESVLFLCFNEILKNTLRKQYAALYPRIQFHNPHSLYYNLCRRFISGFRKPETQEEINSEDFHLYSEIAGKITPESVPFDHIVIDEGQDMNVFPIVGEKIIPKLRDVVRKKGGTFFVFYDELQMVQSRELPPFLTNPDAKLSLYRNCRNTVNIAKSSISSVKPGEEPKMMEGSLNGERVRIHFYTHNAGKPAESDEIARGEVKKIIEDLERSGIRRDEMVILTARGRSKDHSIFDDEPMDADQFFRTWNGVRFTTCRRFKGLEAKAVILTDVTKGAFHILNEENLQWQEEKKRPYPYSHLLFYVAASRAKLRLEIFSPLTKKECLKILENTFHQDISGVKKEDAKSALATALNADVVGG